MKIYPEYVAKDRVMQPGQEGSAVDALDFVWKGSRILGQIYVPVHTPGEKHPLAITLHGFPGYTNNQDLDHALRRTGFVTVHPFAPGAWGSEGYYSFDGLVECAMALLDYCKTDEFAEKYHICRDNIFFVGHSMGGMTSINVLRRRDDVKAGVFLAPFDVAQFYYEGHTPDELRPLFEEGVILRTPGNYMDFLLQNGADTAKDLLFIDAAEGIKEKNFLFVGGELDPLAPPATMCAPLYEKAKALSSGKAKQEYVLIHSDHGFNDQRIYLAQTVADYLACLVE
ncbi:MAG: alpha/beta fold hydrolase [Firmicutes bacterium]|nr:alpha/beta fold hydrolase [Bacillota bacterium]